MPDEPEKLALAVDRSPRPETTCDDSSTLWFRPGGSLARVHRPSNAKLGPARVPVREGTCKYFDSRLKLAERS
jgi:hypothetical protein